MQVVKPRLVVPENDSHDMNQRDLASANCRFVVPCHNRIQRSFSRMLLTRYDFFLRRAFQASMPWSFLLLITCPLVT